jgi:hypothetical protein
MAVKKTRNIWPHYLMKPDVQPADFKQGKAMQKILDVRIGFEYPHCAIKFLNLIINF